MAITFHPQNYQEPKVYDKEDHQNFKSWYFEKIHKQLTKSEMESTRESFIYDMDYYLSLPKPSKNIEIFS